MVSASTLLIWLTCSIIYFLWDLKKIFFIEQIPFMHPPLLHLQGRLGTFIESWVLYCMGMKDATEQDVVVCPCQPSQDAKDAVSSKSAFVTEQATERAWLKQNKQKTTEYNIQ